MRVTNSTKIVHGAWLVVLMLCGSVGCEDREPAPPPSKPAETTRPVANMQPIRIDVQTKMREVEIELERIEDLLATDQDNDLMVTMEQLQDVSLRIEDTREMLRENQGRQSQRFKRFREDAEKRLKRYEERLESLKERMPAPSDDAGTD